jgi:A/G-specific adenine glycosylase
VSDLSPALRPTLLAWSDRRLRDLPWRRTRDPWAILVAETMLQQTQVARVTDRWERFLQRFPDPPTCARAPASELLREWAGLGYNRRALMLHRAAGVICDDHGGVVPDELDRLMALPGVGPYTGRAVLAFAFEIEAAPVDTNIGRVLARLGGERLGVAEAQRMADSLVPAEAVWRWNQGLMELGATVCRKRSPECVECPVAACCAWRGRGPDPAERSAAVARPQPSFAGSDRQLRGRAVDALRVAPVPVNELAARISGEDEARGLRVLERLLAEGMIEQDGERLRLPGDGQAGPVSDPSRASIA